MVILPCEFLPLFLFKLTTSDFSGSFLVISSNVETLICLLAGEVGLNFLILIGFPSFYLPIIPSLRRILSSWSHLLVLRLPFSSLVFYHYAYLVSSSCQDSSWY